jgi:hypothetical protein
LLGCLFEEALFEGFLGFEVWIGVVGSGCICMYPSISILSVIRESERGRELELCACPGPVAWWGAL